MLVSVLTASILPLVPGQGKGTVGVEVFVKGLANWGCVVVIQRLRGWATMRPDLRQPFVLRVALGQIATLPLVIAGIACWSGLGGSTGWWRHDLFLRVFGVGVHRFGDRRWTICIANHSSAPFLKRGINKLKDYCRTGKEPRTCPSCCAPVLRKMQLRSKKYASWPTAVTLQAIGLCALG